MTRQHPRAPIELKVAYKRMNAFFADYTRDISKGGMFIKSESPLSAGSELEFEITLPKHPAPIKLTGNVMWSELSRGMGIQFTWKSEAERTAFEKLVEELMIEALGETIYRQLIEKGRE